MQQIVKFVTIRILMIKLQSIRREVLSGNVLLCTLGLSHIGRLIKTVRIVR